MDFDYGISFCAGNEELWKKDATVADLIAILKEFPSDLRISAFFDCRVDNGNNVVYIEDKRTTSLVDIVLECPMCSQHLKLQPNDHIIN